MVLQPPRETLGWRADGIKRPSSFRRFVVKLRLPSLLSLFDSPRGLLLQSARESNHAQSLSVFLTHITYHRRISIRHPPSWGSREKGPCPLSGSAACFCFLPWGPRDPGRQQGLSLTGCWAAGWTLSGSVGSFAHSTRHPLTSDTLGPAGAPTRTPESPKLRGVVLGSAVVNGGDWTDWCRSPRYLLGFSWRPWPDGDGGGLSFVRTYGGGIYSFVVCCWKRDREDGEARKAPTLEA